MAVYNGSRYLREALQSIAHQTFTDFEFIVVDDGSTDESRDILAAAAKSDSRIRLYRQNQNQGLTKALNAGLAQARGEYIARMDHDDRSHKSRLMTQVKFLDANPDYLLVASGHRAIDWKGKSLRVINEPLDDWQTRWLGSFNPPAPHPTYLFRRLGSDGAPFRYEESFVTAQDFDLWSRLSDAGKTAVLEDVLVDYRRHADAISVRHRHAQAESCRRIGRRNLAKRYESVDLNALDPLFDVFAYRCRVTPEVIRRSVRAVDLMLAYDLPTAPSPGHRAWLRRKAAGLLADALLSRGGGLRSPLNLLHFLFQGRGHLRALLGAVAQSPQIAAKSLARCAEPRHQHSA
jgi:glycosyltransferase involved in cell wall biosynthesis